jgi:hypothetical protein
MCILKYCKEALVGKSTSFHHKAITGVVLMILGVVVAKSLGHNEELIIAVLGDASGYSLHGIGLIPFVEKILAEVA